MIIQELKQNFVPCYISDFNVDLLYFMYYFNISKYMCKYKNIFLKIPLDNIIAFTKIIEHLHEKTNYLHMQKQRCRSALK